jgi:hypothetical protein
VLRQEPLLVELLVVVVVLARLVAVYLALEAQEAMLVVRVEATDQVVAAEAFLQAVEIMAFPESVLFGPVVQV